MRLKSWVLSSSAGCLCGFFKPGGSQFRVQDPVEVWRGQAAPTVRSYLYR